MTYECCFDAYDGSAGAAPTIYVTYNNRSGIRMKRLMVIIIAAACIAGCTVSTHTTGRVVPSVDITKDGTYERDGWKYVFDVKSNDGKDRGWWGYLYRNGKHLGDLPDLSVGQKMETPWGPMYWVDVPQHIFGYHGWLPLELTRDAWTSQHSPINWNNVKDFQQSPAGYVANRAEPEE